MWWPITAIENLPRKSLNSRPTLSRYWISRVDWDWFLQSSRIYWNWICQWKTWRNKKSLWNCYFGYKLWQCGHKLFLKQYVSKIIYPNKVPYNPGRLSVLLQFRFMYNQHDFDISEILFWIFQAINFKTETIPETSINQICQILWDSDFWPCLENDFQWTGFFIYFKLNFLLPV